MLVSKLKPESHSAGHVATPMVASKVVEAPCVTNTSRYINVVATVDRYVKIGSTVRPVELVISNVGIDDCWRLDVVVGEMLRISLGLSWSDQQEDHKKGDNDDG